MAWIYVVSSVKRKATCFTISVIVCLFVGRWCSVQRSSPLLFCVQITQELLGPLLYLNNIAVYETYSTIFYDIYCSHIGYGCCSFAYVDGHGRILTSSMSVWCCCVICGVDNQLLLPFVLCMQCGWHHHYDAFVFVSSYLFSFFPTQKIQHHDSATVLNNKNCYHCLCSSKTAFWGERGVWYSLDFYFILTGVLTTWATRYLHQSYHILEFSVLLWSIQTNIYT